MLTHSKRQPFTLLRRVLSGGGDTASSKVCLMAKLCRDTTEARQTCKMDVDELESNLQQHSFFYLLVGQ